MKISAVHITSMTLNFIHFLFKTLQFLGYFSSNLNIKIPISLLIDKINICCGYSFSLLEHNESFSTYLILIR